MMGGGVALWSKGHTLLFLDFDNKFTLFIGQFYLAKNSSKPIFELKYFFNQALKRSVPKR